MWIAQDAKELRIAVHVNQRIPPHVPTGEREETARKYFAAVRNEDKSATIADAGGPECNALCAVVASFFLARPRSCFCFSMMKRR